MIDLKPCPLCSGPAEDDGHDALGKRVRCPKCELYCDVPMWERFPRRDETAAEIAREMREYASAPNKALVRHWASRLEAVAEQETHGLFRITRVEVDQ